MARIHTPPPAPPPLAVRISTAAQMVGLSRRSLERLIETHRLSSRRIGGARVILIRDLERLLRTDRPAPIVPPPAQSGAQQ